MELLFRGFALIYLERHNEYLFRECFQMYFIFVMAFPRDRAWAPFCLTYIQVKSSTLSVATFYQFSYSDDSQLYLSFNPNCAVSQDEAIRSMETCISDVKQWMIADKLMLNDDKTEFIVIASRHLLKKTAINRSFSRDVTVISAAILVYSIQLRN